MRIRVLLPLLFVFAAPSRANDRPPSVEGFACPADTNLEQRRYSARYFYNPGGLAKWCERSGVKEGPFAEWDQSNHLKENGNFVAGEEHGTWFYWYASGRLRAEARFEAGRRIWSRGFYETGNPSGELEGYDHQKIRAWHEDGKLMLEGARRCRLVDLSDPVAPDDPIDYCRHCGEWVCRAQDGRPRPCDGKLAVKACRVTGTGASCAPCVVSEKLACTPGAALETEIDQRDRELGVRQV